MLTSTSVLTRYGPDAPSGECNARNQAAKYASGESAAWQIDPGMFGLFPYRQGRQRKIRVRKCTNGNAVVIGPDVIVPLDRAPAIRTKVKAHLATCSFNISRIDFFRTFDTDKGFLEVYARMHDRARPSLAGIAVA
jgi:hypothetical protein